MSPDLKLGYKKYNKEVYFW